MAKVIKNKMLKKGKNKMQKDRKGKEVCEIFNISKGKKDKNIELCGAAGIRKEKTSRQAKESENKQIFYIIAIMAAVLALFFLVYFISQQSKKFEYNGFKFEKIMYDKLPLYYTKISITRVDDSVINYNLFLRNDPRKLNIKSEASVKFMAGTIFISLNRNFEKCEDTSLAMTNLGMLFGAFAFNAKAALDNPEDAEAFGRQYVTCENTKNSTVIMYKEANETSIMQQGDCYVINVANCNVLNATEGFIMQTLSDMQRKP